MQILILNSTWIRFWLRFPRELVSSKELETIQLSMQPWSSIGKIERDKLDRAQRRAAKIVLKTKDSDAEKNLKWLPLSMRRDMHTINLTFKCLKGSPPMFFKDYFKVFRTVHNTRGSEHNLLLPEVRTETARKSFYFNESKLFNNIASEVKDSKSVVIFKTRTLELHRSKVF